MKAKEIRAQLEALQQELETLHPVTDAELSAQVAAGGNAAQLVDQAAETDKRRRTLTIQADALRKQLGAAIKAEAGPTIAKHEHEREKAIQAARRALRTAHNAIDSFSDAISAFEYEATEAEQAGRLANEAARQSGLTMPVAMLGIGTQEFYQMDRRITAILRPHRRDGSQLGKQQIDLEG